MPVSPARPRPRWLWALLCAPLGCAMPGLSIPPSLAATHPNPIEADGIAFFDNLRAGDLEAKDVESTGHQTEETSWPFRGERTRARFAFTLVEHGRPLGRVDCAFASAARKEVMSLIVSEKEGGLGCRADGDLRLRIDLHPGPDHAGHLVGTFLLDGFQGELRPQLGRTQHQREGLLGYEVLHEGALIAAVETHGPGQRLWLQPGLSDPARRGAAAAAFALYILERKR